MKVRDASGPSNAHRAYLFTCIGCYNLREKDLSGVTAAFSSFAFAWSDARRSTCFLQNLDVGR